MTVDSSDTIPIYNQVLELSFGIDIAYCTIIILSSQTNMILLSNPMNMLLQQLVQSCKNKARAFCKQPPIIGAREGIDKLAHSYKIKISKLVRKHLQAAKHNLNKVYNQLEFERLDAQLEEAELSRTNNTGKTWKIVNIITNRKLSPTGKLKRKSPDERKTQCQLGQ